MLKIMEMKQLIQNLFIQFTPGSQEQLKYPRYGISYLQICNSQQDALFIDSNIQDLDNPIIFYKLRQQNISNSPDIDPQANIPILDDPSKLISNKIVINVSKTHIPPFTMENVDEKYKISSTYLSRYTNIKPYNSNMLFDTRNVYATSAFITNYRIENNGEEDIIYDYYDNIIEDKRDQLIFGGFNFQSNNRFITIDLSQGFSDIRWEVVI